MKFILKGNSLTREAIVPQIRERVSDTKRLGYFIEATTPEKEKGLTKNINLPDVIFIVHVVPINKIGEDYYLDKVKSGSFFI